MPSFPTSTFIGQSIGFSELEGSPSRAHSGGVSVITVEGMTSWTDIDGFITFLMPVGFNVGGMIGASLVANTAFRVFDYNVEGFGGIGTPTANGLNSYPLAKWTIKCHVPTGQLPDLSQPYNNDPVPLLTHTWRIGGQHLTLNGQSLRWQTDAKLPGVRVPGTLFIPTIEHSVKWANLLNPPFAAIRQTMNCINTSTVTFSTGIAAVGQLLFLGAECDTTIGSNSELQRTLTYKFSERPLYVSGVALDWNMYMRDDSQPGFSSTGWDRLLNLSTALPPHPQANFLNLFPNTF